MATTKTTELTPPVNITTPRSDSSTQPATHGQGWTLTVEHCAYILIAILALIVHLWQLDNRALHHDETLHAVYSWYIYSGDGYIHDPLLHGPFLYYLGAVFYFLFGDTDFTARLAPALFGTVLTLLPFLVRRELGRPAALVASLYLLISPVFLYVGRFLRHDMYSMVFEMLVFVAIVRYGSTRQPRWLYLGVAAFALMYTNQETSYLFALIMVTPLVVLLLWRVFKPGIALVGMLGVSLALLVFVLPGEAVVGGGHTATRNNETGEMEVASYGPIFGWGPLETEDNAYALRIRNRPDSHNGTLLQSLGGYLADLWLFFRHPAILLGIGLLLATTALLTWLIWLWRGADERTFWQRALQRGDEVIATYHSLSQGHRWLVALAIFFVIYALFFTAFLTNIIGVVSGTTGSLLYWLAQHNVERGGQPAYYYLVLLFVYEPLALLWAGVGLLLVAGGLVWRLRSRLAPHASGSDSSEAALASMLPLPAPASFVPLLLAWWVITALGIYSWAGEKMPWLSVHVALPMVLLGAWAFQSIVAWGFRHTSLGQSRSSFALVAGFFGLMVGLGFVRMASYVQSGGQEGVSSAIIVGLTFALLLLLFVAAGFLQSWRWSLAALAVCVALSGSLYTIRSAYRVSYQLGDVPREMLIYTQTSPDVMRVVRRLEEISELRTAGLDMPIIYDNETVWLWYLRDFTNASNNGGMLSAPPDESVQAVLMLSENVGRNLDTLEHLAGFRIQRYPLRWWFPEGAIYQKGSDWRTINLDSASLLTRAMRAPFDDETQRRLWQFLMHRDLAAPLGSTDFILAVRPEIADQIGPGIGAE